MILVDTSVLIDFFKGMPYGINDSDFTNMAKAIKELKIHENKVQ